jgi:SAM-dependent methyltransferase
MITNESIRELVNTIRLPVFRLINRNKQSFFCPVCGYEGPFMDVNPQTGLRKNAKCPKCNALERHRLQYLALSTVLDSIEASKLRMLHFAPEPFFRKFLSQRFGQYETADIEMEGVDFKVDIQSLQFTDETYDFVFASHVLEHVPDDIKAISEIRRILKPGGIALLPVPIVSDVTIEYPEPNPSEAYHLRAPGYDYFERYKQYFSKIEQITSNSFPEKYQLFLCEDRSQWPTRECPLRTSMKGDKHIDIVPICYV